MADKQSAFRTEPGSQALHSAPRRSTDPGASGTLRTLVIDDDPGIRRTLALCLKGFGCSVEQAATGREALRTVRTQPVDLAFCDLRLEKESGLDLVPRLLAERPQLDVVVITAYAAVDTAVDAMRLGAKDYLPKPFTPEQIRGQVDRARERRRAELHLADDEAGFEDAAQLETTSPRMKAALEVLARAATHDVPVLLRGERGSGQGVLARRLHAQSPRRDRPFAVVGCAALSEESLAA